MYILVHNPLIHNSNLTIDNKNQQASNADNQDSMSDELNISLENRLTQMGLSKTLINELVSVAVRVNYGQVKIFASFFTFA